MRTERLTAAFRYAAQLHVTQLRKGTPVPYIAHLMAVAAIVLEHGGREGQVIAALLHDAIEDHPRGGATRQEIGEQFGPEDRWRRSWSACEQVGACRTGIVKGWLPRPAHAILAGT